jgi:hypothetical protein
MSYSRLTPSSEFVSSLCVYSWSVCFFLKLNCFNTVILDGGIIVHLVCLLAVVSDLDVVCMHDCVSDFVAW